MHTEVMMVGPALADKWLASNDANRSISQYIVKQYANAMKSGEWTLTHQGIAFDDAGRLRDGQHRLLAVVMADVEVPMSVTWGVSGDSFDRMDVGHKRGAAQFLGARGNIIAGAARLLYDDWPTVRLPSRTPTVHQIMRVVESRPTLTEMAPTARAVYARTKISGSQHLAVLAVAATTPFRDKIDSWVDGLVTGAGLGQTDPRLHLRNRWAVRGKQLNAARVEGPYLLTRAWNAYAVGEPMSLIKWSPNFAPIPVVGAS